MFGPDKCGSSNARTHVIFNYPPKGDDSNLLIKKDVKMEKDQVSHLYTLHVKADGTFEVSTTPGERSPSEMLFFCSSPFLLGKCLYFGHFLQLAHDIHVLDSQ